MTLVVLSPSPWRRCKTAVCLHGALWCLCSSLTTSQRPRTPHLALQLFTFRVCASLSFLCLFTHGGSRWDHSCNRPPLGFSALHCDSQLPSHDCRHRRRLHHRHRLQLPPRSCRTQNNVGFDVSTHTRLSCLWTPTQTAQPSSTLIQDATT